jgi:hypothetical protein
MRRLLLFIVLLVLSFNSFALECTISDISASLKFPTPQSACDYRASLSASWAYSIVEGNNSSGICRMYNTSNTAVGSRSYACSANNTCSGIKVRSPVTGGCICPSGTVDDGAGGCRQECPAGQEWNGSACACPAGQVDDGNGGCRQECPAGQEWNGSACACPAGQELVNGQCVDQCVSPQVRKEDGYCGCPQTPSGFASILMGDQCVALCPPTNRPDMILSVDGSDCVCPEGTIEHDNPFDENPPVYRCRQECRYDQIWNMQPGGGWACSCPPEAPIDYDGQCRSECPEGTNWNADLGTCEIMCRWDQVKIDGVCQCAAGQEDVDGECRAQCRTDQIRIEGVCDCPSGFMEQGGQCVPVESSTSSGDDGSTSGDSSTTSSTSGDSSTTSSTSGDSSTTSSTSGDSSTTSGDSSTTSGDGSTSGDSSTTSGDSSTSGSDGDTSTSGDSSSGTDGTSGEDPGTSGGSGLSKTEAKFPEIKESQSVQETLENFMDTVKEGGIYQEIDKLSCINPSAGGCPFNISFELFGQSFSMADYCPVFEELMSYVGAVFLLLYFLLAIRIVASA